MCLVFFFSSRRRHTRSTREWSSDVCSSDLSSNAEICQQQPHWTSCVGWLATQRHLEHDFRTAEHSVGLTQYVPEWQSPDRRPGCSDSKIRLPWRGSRMLLVRPLLVCDCSQHLPQCQLHQSGWHTRNATATPLWHLGAEYRCLRPQTQQPGRQLVPTLQAK